MKPRVKLAETATPHGSQMALYEHDGDFLMTIDGQDLMDSRQHESELELARLGCGHLTGRKAGRVLIGGLGMGYTLRQTLDMVGAQCEVVVVELLDAIVGWNRTFLAGLNGDALCDKRVEVVTGDAVQLIARARHRFDVILLDIDNGPRAMTAPGNRRLYGNEGVACCRRALREKGVLGVWSAEASKPFERRLVYCGFHVRRYLVNAYKGAKSPTRFVWVASSDRRMLPPGGGEPRLPPGGSGRNARPPFKKRIRSVDKDRLTGHDE